MSSTNFTPYEVTMIANALLDQAADAFNDDDPEGAEALATLAFRVDPTQRVEPYRYYAARDDDTNVVYVEGVQGVRVYYKRSGVDGAISLRPFNDTFRKVNITNA